MAPRCLLQPLSKQLDIPVFLTPAFVSPRAGTTVTRPFTSSTARCGRRQNHRKRGTSGHRKAIPKAPIYQRATFLPVPVENPDRRAHFKTSDTHGLWGFFADDKAAVLSPEDEASHGRPWTYKELSVKDWDELHKLYWTCLLELNRTVTRLHEMRRIQIGYGDYEATGRRNAIDETLKNIRKVLLYRHVNYAEARNLLEANEDAEALLADPEEIDEDSDADYEDNVGVQDLVEAGLSSPPKASVHDPFPTPPSTQETTTR